MRQSMSQRFCGYSTRWCPNNGTFSKSDHRRYNIWPYLYVDIPRWTCLRIRRSSCRSLRKIRHWIPQIATWKDQTPCFGQPVRRPAPGRTSYFPGIRTRWVVGIDRESPCQVPNHGPREWRRCLVSRCRYKRIMRGRSRLQTWSPLWSWLNQGGEEERYRSVLLGLAIVDFN